MSQEEEDLYDFMFSMGDTQVRQRIKEMAARGHASSTAVGSYTIAHVAGRLLGILKDLPKRSARQKTLHRILKEYGYARALALCLSVTLDAVIKNRENPQGRSVNRLRSLFAGALRNDWDLLNMLEQRQKRSTGRDSKRSRTAREAANRKRYLEKSGYTGVDIDPQDLMSVCSLVLSIVLQHSGVFSSRMTSTMEFGRKTRRFSPIVECTEAFTDWWNTSIDKVAEITPRYYPISSPPDDWRKDGTGGFPTHTGRYTTAIKARVIGGSAPKEIQGSIEGADDMLRALNTLQRTPWTINQRVYDVFCEAYDGHWPDLGWVTEVLPAPEWSEDLEKGTPEWDQYRRDRRRHRDSEEQFFITRLRAGRLKYISSVFSGIPRFWYVYAADFRGRVYPQTSALSPQGPDIDRGLLQFADGKALGTQEGLEWFLRAGANRFGYDKVPFSARLEWVREHHAQILRCAADPARQRWWTEAGSPWQFLAWCFEYADLQEVKDPLLFVSHLPIAQDGSNNGLQIYSLLFRDPVGAHATNCTPCDSPQDAYQEVADAVTKRLWEIRRDPSQDPKHQRWAREFLELLETMGLSGIPRNAVKRPVMTLPYGCTLFSCQKYVMEWYISWVRDQNLPNPPFTQGDTYSVFRWLGSLVWEAIETVVDLAVRAMGWLRECADIAAAENVSLSWTTPTGLKVTNSYRKTQTKDITVRYTTGRTLRVKTPTLQDEVDRRLSMNGIAPNWVHSFDAAAMARTVEYASERGVTHFHMVHDSFATHAADSETLAWALREAYSSIFSQDWVELHLREWQNLVTAPLPPPPPHGGLDTDNLKQSTYFFH